jgi:hypothetical protein
MKETIKSIILWHEQTFPDATQEGQIDKYFKEEAEFLTAMEIGSFNEAINEMADCFIVACGIGRFDIILAARFMGRVFNMFANDAGFTKTTLQKAIDKKMEINRNRKWGKKGNSYQHIEEGE